VTASCPSCGAPVEAADSFCESCGTELAPPAVSTPPAGYTAECPVCSVDPAAPPATISAEGYCESCGRKVPSGRDHSELDLGLLAGVTDRGLRHPRNEDAMALATADAPGGPVAIAVVCDGVSTSPRPDEASLAAAQAAVRALLTSARRGDDPAQASSTAVRLAHQVLVKLGSRGEAPSTTYVSAVIDGTAVTVCWLGDSRAYWLVEGSGATRLSTDDSLAEEMIAAGTLAEAEAMASPQAHVITRWLGADLADTQPHVVRFEPPGPGVVLVCSDGLWNYQPEAAGLAKLAVPAAYTDALGTAAALVKFALDAGGLDNITVVLAPFPLAPPDSEPPHPPTVPVRRPATLPRRIPHDRVRLHHRRRPEPVPARGRARGQRHRHRHLWRGRRRAPRVGWLRVGWLRIG
jgi:serine/threonine protein phosphatase PrpC